MTGPIFGFSDTWQLVINTGTTIVTFLMVFLIQNTQNRDGAAVQAKLDELIRVGKGHNHFIGIEHLTETEVEEFRTQMRTGREGARRSQSRAGDARARKPSGRAAKRARSPADPPPAADRHSVRNFAKASL